MKRLWLKNRLCPYKKTIPGETAVAITDIIIINPVLPFNETQINIHKTFVILCQCSPSY